MQSPAVGGGAGGGADAQAPIVMADSRENKAHVTDRDFAPRDILSVADVCLLMTAPWNSTGRRPVPSRSSTLKTVRKLCLVLALCLGGLVLAGVATARHGDPSLYPPDDEGSVPVYVVLSYRWMHARLAVPRELLANRPGPAAEALEALGDGDWVLLGWGDARYYRERGVTATRVLDFMRSMLEPDSSAVVEFNPVEGPPTPESTGNRVLSLRLSEAGAERLMDRLDATFALDNGAPAAVGRGRNPGSQFFRSRDTSDLAYNCNHWIADLLHIAGVPTTPLLDTHSAGLALDLRWRARATPVSGDRDAHTPAPQTPPTHSGKYKPISASDTALLVDLEFDGYVIRLGDDLMLETTALPLAQSANAYDETGVRYAALLETPADSLVDIRRLVRIAGDLELLAVCDGAPPRYLALGFRANEGGLFEGPYEIALAAFVSTPGPDAPPDNLCATALYLQP